jgi:hypothetical protein
MSTVPTNWQPGAFQRDQAFSIFALIMWVLLIPNTNRLMSYRFGTDFAAEGEDRSKLRWRPTHAWAAASGITLFVVAIVGFTAHQTPEFLYFQF